MLLSSNISWRLAVATFVTVTGLCIGVASVYYGWWPLLIASLVIDGLDGMIARRLKVETTFGAFLDWHTDAALAHVAAWVFFGWAAPFVTLFLVFIQSISRAFDKKLSGRALVFLVAGIIHL